MEGGSVRGGLEAPGRLVGVGVSSSLFRSVVGPGASCNDFFDDWLQGRDPEFSRAFNTHGRLLPRRFILAGIAHVQRKKKGEDNSRWVYIGDEIDRDERRK